MPIIETSEINRMCIQHLQYMDLYTEYQGLTILLVSRLVIIKNAFTQKTIINNKAFKTISNENTNLKQ